MIGTESTIDCLRTSFGRIKSRRSSRDLTYSKVMQMIGTESLIDCLRTSFGRIRSRRSSRDLTYSKVTQMIGTKSLIDCLCTSFWEDQVQTQFKRFDLFEGHADDWDRVFDRLPTYLFQEDQVKTQFRSQTYSKVMQMIGTESWQTAYVPLLGGSGPDVVQEFVGRHLVNHGDDRDL